MTALADLITTWYTGWAQCRGLRRAKPTPDGLRATPRLPGRHTDLITAEPSTPTLTRLATEVTDADTPTWLIIATTDPDTIHKALTDAGLAPAQPNQTLYTCTLRKHPSHTTPNTHQVGTDTDNNPTTALATDTNGQVAASGTMSVTGGHAVIDAVRTDPPHRRLGLASAIVSALAQRAAESGAGTGIAVAGDDGASLATHLGWRPQATVLFARAEPDN